MTFVFLLKGERAIVQTIEQLSLETILKEKGCFLVPNKFLTEIQQFHGIDRHGAIYKMRTKHERSCYRFVKEQKQPIYFLGIIYPGGRVVVKQLHDVHIDNQNGTVSFLVKKRQQKVLAPFYLQEISSVAEMKGE